MAATERGEMFDCVPCGFHAEIARKDAGANVSIFPCPRCGRRRRAGLAFSLITFMWCCAIMGIAVFFAMEFESSAVPPLLLGAVAVVLSGAIVARRRRRWNDARRTIVFYSH